MEPGWENFIDLNNITWIYHHHTPLLDVSREEPCLDSGAEMEREEPTPPPPPPPSFSEEPFTPSTSRTCEGCEEEIAEVWNHDYDCDGGCGERTKELCEECCEELKQQY